MGRKEEYIKEYKMFSKMSTEQLQKCLGELFRKRYEEQNIEVYNTHRIAARVYIERTRNGNSLIFHLKNWTGA